MIAELRCVVLDRPRPAAPAASCRELPGGEVDQRGRRWASGDDRAAPHTPTGPVPAFRRVPDHRPPTRPDPSVPQQSHPDFGVPGPDRAEERVTALGATVLDPGSAGRGRRVYADPAGHPFCPVRHG
ncbi:VOC family protein [Streptomyces sp. NPDC050388]|uniref:VOC family protein n=1 Tax=Streptomyces sp. NPDC050388 TaxID=3155781 RepID=UPI00341991A8